MDINELKKIVKDMPEHDVRVYLYHILLNISFLEDKEYSLVKFSDDLKGIYDLILNPENPNANIHSEGNYKKVHILFGYPFLRHALKELNLHEEESIISFNDNFAIGPIGRLDEEDGQKTRYHWLKQNLNSSEEYDEYLEDFQRAINQINSIPKEVPIYFWVSENAHEQTGLLFAMSLLRKRTNSISIINTAKQYSELFKLKAKKYVPFSSGTIIHEDLKGIYKYSQENQKYLTDIERTHFETQWLSLAENHDILRLWEDSKIKSVSEDYYDEFIIEKAKKLLGKQKKFIPSARLIGEVYGNIYQYVGDDFLEYRLRKLIDKGIFEFEGSLEAMRYYSIKLS